MKASYIYTLLSYVFSISALGQTTELGYRPFVEEGKIWETQVGGIKENVYRYQIEGDTIIAGESWKKAYSSYGFYHNSYFAAIREVGRKIYAIAKGSNRPRLLYDFNLKAGDWVKCGMEGNAFCCLLEKGEKADSLLGFQFISYLKVEHIDTIKYSYYNDNDKYFRRFTLTAFDAYQEPYVDDDGFIRCNIIWVEGIGSGAGPFCPWMPLPPRRFSIQQCYIGRQFLFGTDGFRQEEYPSIVIGSQSEVIPPTDVYDLQGRKNNSQFRRKGIYIQNGVKRVIK